jgi:antitoxin ParD1/3/4
MNVIIKPEMEAFVARKLKAGEFANASDLVNEALEVLQEQEEFTPEHEAYLKREIKRGIDALDAGRVAHFDAASVIAEQHRRLDARRNGG